jgi:hypothetical protein
MLRFLKKFGCLAVFVSGFQSAYGFALLGPLNEAFQTTTIGYGLPGDIGGPKMIGEDYRWTTPVSYYAFDNTFLNFFGSNGVAAVGQAFDLLNALTNLSPSLSKMDINQFPPEAIRINPRAQTLRLSDVKTIALTHIMEELGLTDPERYVWTLRFRDVISGLSCPNMFYWVIQRNFDPSTFEPSPYINGVLYSYRIQEICSGTDPLAVTINFPVDPTAPAEGSTLLSVKARFFGGYAIGLSRDDIGGLRYLLRTNNVHWESVSSDSTEYVTNTTQAQLLFGSNITSLAYDSVTNSAAALAALYPGLVVSSSSNYFVNTWVTNPTAYFTNFPYDPVGTAPHLVYATNREFTIQTRYQHTFANIFTFSNTPSGWVPVPVITAPTNLTRTSVTLQTVSSLNPPYLPVDSSNTVTTVKLEKFKTNMIIGEYFLLPTNSCSIDILGLQAILTNHYTNLIVNATNTVVDTNTLGGFSTNFVERSLITVSTNHVFVYYPVECGTNNATLRQGMDMISFRRASYDSLVGRFFQPITNTYRLTAITNSRAYTTSFQRVVTRPDWLFNTADLGDIGTTRTDTSVNFINGTQGTNGAGPGNIEPNMQITFNRIVPFWENTFSSNLVNSGLSELSAFKYFAWASYDGSTNEPVVYPSGTSLRDLENMILFSVITTDLPSGTVGVPYVDDSGTNDPVLVQLQAAGGELPYTWAVTAGHLPAPFTLNADGTISDGNGQPPVPRPGTEGDYIFTASVTERGGRVALRTFKLTIK